MAMDTLTIELEVYERQYSLTQRTLPDAVYTAELSALGEPEGARAFVEAFIPTIRALSPDVAATYSAAWLGRICAAYHYAQWHDAVLLDLSPGNLTVQLAGVPRVRNFRLKSLRGERLCEPCSEQSMRGHTEHFYQSQIRPLLETIAQTCGIRVRELWGQVATVLHYAKDAWLEAEKDASQCERLDTVLELVFHRLPGEIFGRAANPFDIEFIMVDNPRIPGTSMRLKATCCLAYKTDSDHGYCYSCPRLKPAERERIKEELVKTLVTSNG